MPDGPFKAMTPDPSSVRPICAPEKCEKCGALVWAGDWPFCKGNPEDHERRRDVRRGHCGGCCHDRRGRDVCHDAHEACPGCDALEDGD